jgi:hypothetical protein
VRWALDRVKKDASPGQDGVVVDMMMVDVLFDVWVSLFEYGSLVWEYGMVPSTWKQSFMAPFQRNRPSTLSGGIL